jgi:hypothetical protein
MDVSKAKTVIIVLLVAFNIFLLANNFIYHDTQGASRETLENAVRILEQRGVELECGIPVTEGGSHHRLVYMQAVLDRERIATTLLGENRETQDNSYYLSATKKLIFSGEASFVYTDQMVLTSEANRFDQAEAAETAYGFMKDKGLLDGKYVLDRADRGNDGSFILHYIEKYEGQLLFDNYFTIQLNDKVIMSVEYQRYQIKGFSAEIIEQPEVYQTLLSYFMNDSDVVITSIDSGYKLTDDTTADTIESIEPLPVWRVVVKGETEPLYISPHDISL